jgi:A1 cistron-splicing factor AAR2
MFDETGMSGNSVLDYDPDLRDDFKMLLITFKSRLNEQLLAQGSKLTDQQTAVGKAFEELESWLWRWSWDLRGNYVRSGKIQLEDGVSHLFLRALFPISLVVKCVDIL